MSGEEIEVSAWQALEIIRRRVQECRENGENDMRGLLWYIEYVSKKVEEGATYEELIEDIFGSFELDF